MGQVKDCKHSVFDKLWGEWKCKNKSHVLHHPDIQCEKCKDYIKVPDKEIDISLDD